MEKTIIRYVDLPCGIKGFVRRDDNGDYNVYINARQSWQMQKLALEHELRHIQCDDLHNCKSISEVESHSK